MANRVTIYGAKGDKATEILRREMRTMSLNYDFYDVVAQPAVRERLRTQLNEDIERFPKVEVACANTNGSVFLSNPDLNTLRQTLYGEDILGITSFWI
jgi:hypothetical protein